MTTIVLPPKRMNKNEIQNRSSLLATRACYSTRSLFLNIFFHRSIVDDVQAHVMVIIKCNQHICEAFMPEYLYDAGLSQNENKAAIWAPFSREICNHLNVCYSTRAIFFLKPRKRVKQPSSSFLCKIFQQSYDPAKRFMAMALRNRK